MAHNCTVIGGDTLLLRLNFLFIIFVTKARQGGVVWQEGSGFLPQSKDIHVSSLTGDSKFPIGVNVSVNGYVSAM